MYKPVCVTAALSPPSPILSSRSFYVSSYERTIQKRASLWNLELNAARICEKVPDPQGITLNTWLTLSLLSIVSGSKTPRCFGERIQWQPVALSKGPTTVGSSSPFSMSRWTQIYYPKCGGIFLSRAMDTVQNIGHSYYQGRTKGRAGRAAAPSANL